MQPETGVRAAVVGAGYLGQRIALRLREQGFSVIATAVSDASQERLRSDGFDARRLDLAAPETYFSIADASAVIICPAPSDSDEASYARLYGAGVPRLCAWLAERSPVPRVVYTSSTSVYRETGGEWADEDSAVDAARPKPAALLSAEAAILAAPLSGTVLRLAGIYGPGRNRLQAIEAGTLAPAMPNDIGNLIQVDDAAAAAAFLLQRGAGGEIYLGVDSAPTPRAEMYAWLIAEAKSAGLRPATPSVAIAPLRGGTKRCSNRKLLSLGFTFSYPSFREGYRPLLAALRS